VSAVLGTALNLGERITRKGADPEEGTFSSYISEDWQALGKTWTHTVEVPGLEQRVTIVWPHSWFCLPQKYTLAGTDGSKREDISQAGIYILRGTGTLGGGARCDGDVCDAEAMAILMAITEARVRNLPHLVILTDSDNVLTWIQEAFQRTTNLAKHVRGQALRTLKDAIMLYGRGNFSTFQPSPFTPGFHIAKRVMGA
jgi:hypothetical protein